MDKPFFIMIYSQKGDSAFPMTDSENEDVPMFWATRAEAREVAENHFFASKLGYEIFEMGYGDY